MTAFNNQAGFMLGQGLAATGMGDEQELDRLFELAGGWDGVASAVGVDAGQIPRQRMRTAREDEAYRHWLRGPNQDLDPETGGIQNAARAMGQLGVAAGQLYKNSYQQDQSTRFDDAMFDGMARQAIETPGVMFSALTAMANMASRAAGGRGSANVVLDELSKGLEGLTSGMAEAHFPRPDSPVEGFAHDVGRGATQAATAVGVSAATGNPLGGIVTLMGTGGAEVMGRTYQEALASNADPSVAADQAALAGMTTLVTNALPGAAIFQRIPGGNQIINNVLRRHVIGRVLAAGTAEAVQEGLLESIGHDLAYELARTEDGLTGEEAWEVLRGNPEVWKARGYEALVGSVVGGGIRGGIETQAAVQRGLGGQSASPSAAPTPPQASGPAQAPGVAPEATPAAETPGPVPETVDAPQPVPDPITARPPVPEQSAQPGGAVNPEQAAAAEPRPVFDRAGYETKIATELASLSADQIRTRADEAQSKTRDAERAAWKRITGEDTKRVLKDSQLQQIADQLTTEEEAAIYMSDSDVLQEYADAAEQVQENTEEGVARALMYALLQVGDKTDLASMNPRERLAAFKIMRAGQWASEQGLDTQAITQQAIQLSASQFSDPADAAYMLERFLRPPQSPESATGPQGAESQLGPGESQVEGNQSQLRGSATPQAGQRVQTPSGRQTTPYPQAKEGPPIVDRLNRQNADRWLIENAVEEAKATGQRALAMRFNQARPGLVSDADRSAMQALVYGDQNAATPTEPALQPAPGQPVQPTASREAPAAAPVPPPSRPVARIVPGLKARKPWTKMGTAEAVKRKASETGFQRGIDVYDAQIDADTQQQYGSNPSFNFGGWDKVPTEVKEAVQGDTKLLHHLRRMQKPGTKSVASDYLASAGTDTFVEHLSELVSGESVGPSLRHLRMLGDYDPQAGFLADFYESVSGLGKERPPFDPVDLRDSPVGTRVEIVGQLYQVEEHGDRRLLVRDDGHEMPLDAFETYPVDRGTLKPPAGRFESMRSKDSELDDVWADPDEAVGTDSAETEPQPSSAEPDTVADSDFNPLPEDLSFLDPESDLEPGDEGSFTSARNAMMADDRTLLGLDRLDSPAQRGWMEAMKMAGEQDLHTAEKAGRLADQINLTPRVLSDVETAGLVWRAADLKRQHAAAMNDIANTEDSLRINDLSVLASQIEAEFDKISTALRMGGTEAGRALNARKLTLDQDFSLVAVKSMARAAKGRPLSDAESAKLAELTTKLEQTAAKVESLEAQLREQMAERAVTHRRSRPSRSAPKADFDAKVARARELLRAGCL